MASLKHQYRYSHLNTLKFRPPPPKKQERSTRLEKKSAYVASGVKKKTHILSSAANKIYGLQTWKGSPSVLRGIFHTINSVNNWLALIINSAISNWRKTFRIFNIEAELQFKSWESRFLMHVSQKKKKLEYTLRSHKNTIVNVEFCVHI
jgi:hypothetical protein